MSPTRVDDWQGPSDLFRCLASPVRVGIIALLLQEPRSVGDLVDRLDVSQPLVSQHLKVLREQCLVVGEKDGRRTLYRLMDDHVGHIVADAIAHTGEHRHDHLIDHHSTPLTVPEEDSK